MIKLTVNDFIAGVSDISVTKIDNTIFIANRHAVLPGISGTIPMYDTDGDLTSISADKLRWHDDSGTLTVLTCNTNGITFINPNTEETCFNLEVCETPQLDVKLMILQESKPIIAIDADRTTFFNRIHLKHVERQEITPIGSPTDSKGDFTIISDYLYYCKKEYDGVSKIWIRWKCSDSEW